MGGPRGAVRNSKKAKADAARRIGQQDGDEKEIAEKEKEIGLTSGLIKKGNRYLEQALEKAIKEDGNSQEVARLLKGFVERQERAQARREALLARRAGVASKADGVPQDFASQMEALKREDE